MKILLGLLLLVQCYGMPQMIVDSGKAKCVSIEAPQDTIIRISYDAPGKSSAALIVFVTSVVSYVDENESLHLLISNFEGWERPAL
jgi:hypothetical protein